MAPDGSMTVPFNVAVVTANCACNHEEPLANIAKRKANPPLYRNLFFFN
jgi:hypothetical protein